MKAGSANNSVRSSGYTVAEFVRSDGAPLPRSQREDARAGATIRVTAPKVAGWALADQAVVSAGTFLTGILLARNLSQAEYGAYSLVFGTLLFLNVIHASVVTYPLLIKGSEAGLQELSRYAGASVVLTALLTLPQCVGIAGAAIWLDRMPLSAMGCAALLGWQIQETFRRSLMAHLEHRRALWGDVVSYLGQAALVWLACSAGAVTVEKTLGIMALTSLAAAAIQAKQVGLRLPDCRTLRSSARDFWQLGRWPLSSNVLNAVCISSFFWGLAVLRGTKETGAFQALINILGVSHPVIFALGNLIVPAVAKSNAGGGRREAWTCAWRFGLQGGLLLAPYFLGLLIWPAFSLRMFYGAGSPYLELQTALRVLVIAYAFAYAGQVLSGFLNGVRRTRTVFFVQGCGAACTVAVGLPLVNLFGALGACAGFMTASFVRTILACTFGLARPHRTAT